MLDAVGDNFVVDDFGNAASADSQRDQMRRDALASTYYFATAVCGFGDLHPRLHGAMAAWVQRETRPDPDNPNATLNCRLKLGMAPRGHLKSSVWTIANTLRLVTVNPDLRVLICNETEANIKKWITTMQATVLSPVYQWLFPECVPDIGAVRWNATQLELRRPQPWPQATIEGIPVGGASTSNHYNLIVNDDPVGKKARLEPTTMEKAIDHRKLCWSLMIDPSKDRVFDVGTRWAPQDYIDWVLRNVRGVDVFRLALYDPQGNAVWPERFPPDVVDAIRSEQGPEMFELQYMNDALSSGTVEFDVSRLRTFRYATRLDVRGVEHKFVVLERPQHEGGDRWVSVASLTKVQVLDAGLSPESGDARTANVVIGLAAGVDNRPFDVVVLAARAVKADPNGAMNAARELYEEFDPMTLGVECVGGHVVYFYSMATRWPGMRLRKLKTDTTKSKEVRIREFYPFVDQGRVYVHRQEGFELVREVAAFPHGRTVDLLDALAYTPQIWCPPQRQPTPDEEWEQWKAEAREARLAAMSRRSGGDGRNEITGY